MKATAALALFFVPTMAMAAGVLKFSSEAGDYIGQGQAKEITFGEEILITRSSDGITFYLPPPADYFSLTFRAPQGDDLRVACFEKSQRAPFRDPHRTGLSFSHQSRGCNTVSGRYRILDIEFKDDEVTSLAADFVQHCGGAGSALFGKLRFNSDVTLDTPTLEPAFEIDGHLTYTAAAGAIGGGASGATRAIPLTRLNVNATRNYDNGVSLAFSGDVAGVGNTTWRLELAAPDDAPLSSGAYADAQRFPFQDQGRPGLNFSFGGGGCNDLLGNFNIPSLSYERWDSQVHLMSASFNQRCGALGTGPLTTGDLDLIVTHAEPDGFFVNGFEGPQLPYPVWECP